MTESLVHRPDVPWSIDDLDGLPDDGMRYELVDGSLLVSPMAAAVPHGRIVTLLQRTLVRQAPDEILVAQNIGVARGDRTYFVPDLVVIRASALDRRAGNLGPSDVLLAVEVLSRSNAGRDLILKRHFYAALGIPEYWIVDDDKTALSVLRLTGDAYLEEATVTTVYEADRPFPMTLDVAALF